jgi:hypothetical protein
MLSPLALARNVLVLVAAAGAVVVSALPREAVARELAMAQGTIAISAPADGQRSPACGELIVEARDALDDHLIGRTQPTTDSAGACRYALSVPAQSAVWLRLRPALVAAERVVADRSGAAGVPPAYASRAASGRSVQLRFTIIAPTTFFFAPGEQKTVPLSY